MPIEAATLMSTAARMAATPSRICSELVVRETADGGDDAELTARAGRGGLLAARPQLGDVEPHRAHRRGELARLQ